MSGPPNFDHLSFNGDFKTWAAHMEQPAQRLGDVLYKYRQTWGTCPICEIDYPLNMASHITGRNHCKKLHGKLDYQPPKSMAHLSTFTQYWKLDSGPQPYYSFNHITGRQDFDDIGERSSTMSAPAQPAPRVAGELGQSAPAESVSRVAAAPVPAVGCPSVPPAEDFTKAMSSKEAWRSFMAVPSERLENQLHAATGEWGGVCKVCGVDMGRGAKDHLQSQNHWKKLWQKFSDNRLPPPAVASSLDKPWVQEFATPSRGPYVFNHLTGEQSWKQTANAGASPTEVPRPGSGNVQAFPCASPTEAPRPVNGSVQVFPCASPTEVPRPVNGNAPHTASTTTSANVQTRSATASTQRPANVDAWEEDEQDHPPQTLTSMLPSAHNATASSAPHAAPLITKAPPPTLPTTLAVCTPTTLAVCPPVTSPDSAYVAAFNSKTAWRSFMEKPSAELEAIYHKETGGWGGKCMVCGTDMTRGITDHIPSQNHWRNLWNKLQSNLPGPDAAHEWNRPWVERFNFKNGDYLFNYVTGGQGFEAQLMGNPVAVPAAIEGPPTSLPFTASVPTTTSSRDNGKESAFDPLQLQATPQVNGSASPPFDLTFWLWTEHAKMGAKHLHEELGGRDFHCVICNTPMGENIQEHLLSGQHYQALQTFMARHVTTPNPTEDDLAEGPWIQDFSSIRFNHIFLTFERRLAEGAGH